MQLPLPAELQDFIMTHLSASVDKLLLNATHYPGIDLPFAADQILARQHIREKLPEWYARKGLVFPSRLSAEQCSSETTALYKQQLIKGNSVCDLTGGLGIDSWYFAQKAGQVNYIERSSDYCAAAAHNFSLLGATNIQILNMDCREAIRNLQADTFYIDPARRSEGNKRLFALSDCEPDVLKLKNELLQRGQRLIIKLSPMADITETLRLLPESTEIHLIAVRNECKEVLFVLENNPRQLQIHAVSFSKDGEQQFSFSPEEEKAAPLLLTDCPGSYLYEPHAALLKSGAFKLITLRYDLKKLHQHSHLYTSDHFRENFPGRRFRIRNVYPFSGKLLRKLRKDLPQANIAIRNFPLSVSQIRKTSGIAEGGSVYLFATTIAPARRIIVECEKA